MRFDTGLRLHVGQILKMNVPLEKSCSFWFHVFFFFVLLFFLTNNIKASRKVLFGVDFAVATSGGDDGVDDDGGSCGWGDHDGKSGDGW